MIHSLFEFIRNAPDRCVAGAPAVPLHTHMNGSARVFRSLEMTVKVAAIEIYMERLRDLLSPANEGLAIHEGPGGRGVFVKGVTELFVTDEAEMQAALATVRGSVRAQVPPL